MAQPWDAACGARSSASAIKLQIKIEIRNGSRTFNEGSPSENPARSSMRAHVHEADAIREEHDEHHADAEYHGWDEQEEKSQALEAQVHEVRDDERGLDERQADEHGDHQMDFDLFIAKKDFDSGEEQEPNPHPHKQLRAAYLMAFGRRCVVVCAH